MADEDLSPEALRKRYDGRVRHVAGWTKYRHHEYEDLVQAGHVGVQRARERYFESTEPPPATPFDAAVWSYIRNQIEREAHQQRPFRQRIDDARHAASSEQMEMRFASPQRHDAVAGMADILDQVMGAALVEISADPDLFASDEPTPEVRVEDRQTRTKIAAAVGFLPRRMLEIVEGRLEGLTFDRIAERLGLDERWVRELHGRALRELQDHVDDELSSDRRKVR